MLSPFSKLRDDENVARFVMFSRWVKKDQSIRPDAFMPPPNKELSVTRHRGISEKKLWKHGQLVARNRQKKLYGRADLNVAVARDQNIESVPSPILWKNWNHACLVGWPSDKSLQKSIAQELAANAQYVAIEELHRSSI